MILTVIICQKELSLNVEAFVNKMVLTLPFVMTLTKLLPTLRINIILHLALINVNAQRTIHAVVIVGNHSFLIILTVNLDVLKVLFLILIL